MTTVAEPVRRYQLGGQEQRSLLGRKEPAEAALVVGAVVLGVVISVASGGALYGFLGMAALVLAAALLVFLPVRGRTLFRWLPVDLHFAAARRSGNDVYRNVVRETGVDGATGRRRPLPPPPAVGALRWLEAPYADSTLGVLVQEDDAAVVAVLEVEGPGVGLFDSLDYERTVSRWGGVLRDLANSEGLVRKIQLLERSVPAESLAHERYVQRFGWVPAPPFLRDSYDELQRHIGAVSEQHRNYVVVRIPSDRALARAARSAGGGDAGLAAVVAREVEGLRSRLVEADFKVVRALDTTSLAALLAEQYRPDRWLYGDPRLSPDEAWPRATQAERTHLDVDTGDWLHATAWIREWPVVEVGVNFLAPLLVQVPGVVRTASVVLDLVPTDVALAAAMRDLTADEADASASTKAGRTADPRRGRQLNQAEQRAADLAAGAAGVQLVGYLTVSATSEDELDQAKRLVRSAAARCWLSLEWCDKEQDTAFTNTLPLARGML